MYPKCINFSNGDTVDIRIDSKSQWNVNKSNTTNLKTRSSVNHKLPRRNIYSVCTIEKSPPLQLTKAQVHSIDFYIFELSDRDVVGKEKSSILSVS